MNTVTHRFDISDFCVDCGQSRDHVTTHQLNCFGGEGSNIVAISHRRAAARFGETLLPGRSSPAVTFDARTGITTYQWTLRDPMVTPLVPAFDASDFDWNVPA